MDGMGNGTGNGMASEIQQDLDAIAAQEKQLIFTHIDVDMAWRLGVALREAAAQRAAALTIEIRVGRQTLFHTTMQGCAAINADWVRRKGNTAMHFGKSSYAVGLLLQREGIGLEARYGVSSAEFATQGGGFPLRVQMGGVDNGQTMDAVSTPSMLVGSIAVSGLPQREDHAFVVEVLSQFLGKSPAKLAAKLGVA